VVRKNESLTVPKRCLRTTTNAREYVVVIGHLQRVIVWTRPGPFVADGGARAHSILPGTWHMLPTGELYDDRGGGYFARRNLERTTKRVVAQLERLGHVVTLEQAAA
jgi:hypothetical protein